MEKKETNNYLQIGRLLLKLLKLRFVVMNGNWKEKETLLAATKLKPKKQNDVFKSYYVTGNSTVLLNRV